MQEASASAQRAAPLEREAAATSGDIMAPVAEYSAPPLGQEQRRVSSSSCSHSVARSNEGSEQGGEDKHNATTVTATASANTKSASTHTMMNASADYDHIRNTTLMFFLDRMFLASREGKETRTLHDLSCLFGTREFTKDMRQIVGASRNGLKKFLQSYPSLFTVDGDKVYLTQLKQDPSNPNGSCRDYNKEAVEYFSAKLAQFGASLVPIRNLFGYRSQASQEVRHVSGRNSREFKTFLSAHSDVFEILADDEHVVLKSAIKELESRASDSLQPYSLQLDSLTSLTSLTSCLQQTNAQQANCTSSNISNNDDSGPQSIGALADPYLNRQFAFQIENIMRKAMQIDEQENNNNIEDVDDADEALREYRLTLEQLLEIIKRECKNKLFLEMVKNIEELRRFLRMHPRIFKRIKCAPHEQQQQDESEIQSSARDNVEYVRLLTRAERRELDTQAYPSLMLRQSQPQSSAAAAAIPLRRSETSESHLGAQGASEQPMSLPPATSCLRATAPPFVPGSNVQQQRQPPPPQSQAPAQQQQQQRAPLQRSQSCAAQNNAAAAAGAARSSATQHPADARHALRSYLLKASAGNNSNSGIYAPNKMSNGGANNAIVRNMSNGALQQQQDDMRARTVNIVREASNIISRIMTTTNAVAFDCKGFNLGFDGEITLIQFGYLPNTGAESGDARAINRPSSVFACDETAHANAKVAGKRTKPEVCIFDLITNPELAYCLKPLLESDSIIKIVHDVRNKSNALFNQFGIMLNNVFDTQVANLVIQQQETGVPAYKSRYISMGKLCEIYGNESLLKYRNLIKSRTRHSASAAAAAASAAAANKLKDANYWRARPLTDAMVYESTMDVYCLIGGIYQNLKASIKPEYEPLFDQLNEEGVLARIRPDEIRSVKKERKIDLEVIDLKRKLYSDSPNPIVLSNREIRLLRHVELTEEVRNKIQQCKKVAKKLERLDMKAALAAAAGTGSTHSGQSSLAHNNNNNNTTNGSLTASGSSVASSQCNSMQQDGTQTTPTVAELLSGAEDVMSDLMDSSMFDELKDKMIESSSLLESLDNDEDDAKLQASGLMGSMDAHTAAFHLSSLARRKSAAAALNANQQHQHQHQHDSTCRCNCHHRTSFDNHNHHAPADTTETTKSQSDEHIQPNKTCTSDTSQTAVDSVCQTSQESAATTTTTTTSTEKPSEEQSDQEESSSSNKTSSSKAVDMAVQCDLLC